MLQNITQAYIQLKTELNHIVIYYLPAKLKKRYSKSAILRVAKPLYSLAEAKNHQFATYLDHHREKLEIEISLYNIYFLITKNGNEKFGIAKLQTDNIFNVETEAFIKKKRLRLQRLSSKQKFEQFQRPVHQKILMVVA